VGHDDRSSIRDPKCGADRFAVDLILDCERAASRRNPRDCDPTRWSRTAWRRYLYAAAHAPSLVDLERAYAHNHERGPKLSPTRRPLPLKARAGIFVQ